MAFMNQEKKAAIHAALKKVVPDGWVYTLRVNHHSAINMCIRSAPINLLAEILEEPNNGYKAQAINAGYYAINDKFPIRDFTGPMLDTFKAIIAAMNTGNWDRSDTQTDYFDVGHYVHISIGEYKAPFKVVPARPHKQGGQSHAA